MQGCLSEQTGRFLDETNPDVLQGFLKNTRSPFSIVPSRLTYGKAELGLTFPCLHIVSLGLCCNNWGEIWTLLKSCPGFPQEQDLTLGFWHRWSRVDDSEIS